MVDMKHFAEAVGRSTVGKIDKENRKATVKSIRVKMRRFMSQWERETGLSIPRDVHDSVVPVSALQYTLCCNTSC